MVIVFDNFSPSSSIVPGGTMVFPILGTNAMVHDGNMAVSKNKKILFWLNPNRGLV